MAKKVSVPSRGSSILNKGGYIFGIGEKTVSVPSRGSSILNEIIDTYPYDIFVSVPSRGSSILNTFLNRI